jgi:hypothetical protein
MPKRPPSKLGTFFTSLPGILTSAAALITAVVGLLAYLQTRDGGGGSGGGGGSMWVKEANTTCLVAADRLEGASLDIDPQGQFDLAGFYSDYQDAVEQLVEDFKVLTPSPGQASQASRIVGLWDESSDRFRDAYLTETSGGDGGGEAEAAHALLERGGAIAADLGAVACQQLD